MSECCSDVSIENKFRLFDIKVPINVAVVQKENDGVMRNSNEYLHIYYVQEGRCSIVSLNSQISLLKRDVIFLPPSFCYNIKSSKSEKLQMIRCECVSGFLLQKLSAFEKEFKYSMSLIRQFIYSQNAIVPKVCLTIREKIGQIMNDMFTEYNANNCEYSILLLLDLIKLVFLAVREVENQSDCKPLVGVGFVERNRGIIEKTLEFIDKNYKCDIKLDSACRLAMMSKSYFSYLFREITGKTFVEYINEIRIKKALEMLISKDSSVSDICYAVGFSNICHFNRMFKRMMGVSPTAYRKKWQLY